MELRWQPSFEVSALHAAWAVASGRHLIDSELEQELSPTARELAQLSTHWTTSPTIFWRQLLALAADIPSNQELAERLDKRLQAGAGYKQSLAQLAANIAQCESIARRRFPRMLDELALRSGPLQLAWEARGPGLLFMLAESTEADFIVESATVLLVQPLVGGDGMAHINTNRVHIEALLTDADSRLPETLRLAWLLGQLNLDRPTYGENVNGYVLAHVAEMALLPAILSAAENVQLAQFDLPTLQLALESWLRVPAPELESLANILLAWWETASQSEWPWSTSLAALPKMLDTQH